jgi:antitoxin MazE
MITTVQKWGNSQGLRLNREVLLAARIAVGDAVEVTARAGAITIAPAPPARGARDLRELVKRIPKNNKTVEVDWGVPAGKEVW